MGPFNRFLLVGASAVGVVCMSAPDARAETIDNVVSQAAQKAGEMIMPVASQAVPHIDIDEERIGNGFKKDIGDIEAVLGVNGGQVEAFGRVNLDSDQANTNIEFGAMSTYNVGGANDGSIVGNTFNSLSISGLIEAEQYIGVRAKRVFNVEDNEPSKMQTFQFGVDRDGEMLAVGQMEWSDENSIYGLAGGIVDNDLYAGAFGEIKYEDDIPGRIRINGSAETNSSQFQIQAGVEYNTDPIPNTSIRGVFSAQMGYSGGFNSGFNTPEIGVNDSFGALPREQGLQIATFAGISTEILKGELEIAAGVDQDGRAKFAVRRAF